jgi:hypothetical protein
MDRYEAPFDWERYARSSPPQRSLLLGDWLDDAGRRAQLRARVRQEPGGALRLDSPVTEQVGADNAAGPERRAACVYLVCDPDLVRQALLNPPGADGARLWSNSPYAALGTGTFMLALDEPPQRPQPRAGWHGLQRSGLAQALRYEGSQVALLAAHACDAAMVTSMRGPVFDACEFAENAALRFSSALFGFTLGDHAMLEASMRAAYVALSYQFVGRHLATDPRLLPQANQAMAQALVRAEELMEAFWRGAQQRPQELPIGLEPFAGRVPGFQPVMQRLAEPHAGQPLNLEELGVLVVGAISGTVGNIQAAASKALRALLHDGRAPAGAADPTADPLQALREHARKLDPSHGGACLHHQALWARILRALRPNPPVPFLHRRLTRPLTHQGRTFEQDAILVLDVGALTEEGREVSDHDAAAALFGLYGDSPAEQAMHSCIGRYLAQPLIVEIVRRVLLLPGVEEALDPQDGRVIGLRTAWGFRCLSYPLSYRRDRRLRQQTLNVSMRIKAPIEEHAAKLRKLIAVGAPRIEAVLRESHHVHFAWFEFVESGTHLLLHTVYDGDFESYVEHFALDAGDLFDLLFEHIEDAPPRPVREHPQEFVALIARYNRPPAGGYLFSAYPRLETREITRGAGGAP